MRYKWGEQVDLEAGTKVRVYSFADPSEGIIVGKSGSGMDQSHIIKCTDGIYPSELYPWSTYVSPLTMIEVIE